MNYSYTSQVPASAESWIDCLMLVQLGSSGVTGYTEIHFTKPKAAISTTAMRPHVTFVRSGARTHWYLCSDKGKTYGWGVTAPGGTDRPLEGEGAIAQKVVNDMGEGNHIRRLAEPATDSGGSWAVSTGGKKKSKAWKH